MGRRRIEMHEYRNVLIRLRAGGGDREIVRLGVCAAELFAGGLHMQSVGAAGDLAVCVASAACETAVG